MPAEELSIIAPMVMSVSAHVGDDDEPTSWTVGYAPEPDEDGDRFLLAYLHVASSGGIADVEIGATVINGPEGDISEGDEADAFALLLASASSLDSLFETARIVALGLLGTIEAAAKLPLVSPEPDIIQLVRPNGLS